MTPVLTLTTLLADALLVRVAEGSQRAVVGRAGAQILVPGGLGQLVAVQFAVLLVWPQVLLTVIHHAGQTGLHCPDPAVPKAEVTQDLLAFLTGGAEIRRVETLSLGFLP